MTFSWAMILKLGFGISDEPQSQSSDVALGFFYIGSLLFLLIASPFFFKSLGKLAVVGWIMALCIFVISMFFDQPT